MDYLNFISMPLVSYETTTVGVKDKDNTLIFISLKSILKRRSLFVWKLLRKHDGFVEF